MVSKKMSTFRRFCLGIEKNNEVRALQAIFVDENTNFNESITTVLKFKIGHFQIYHNHVPPKFCTSIVSNVSWDRKEYYGKFENGL